MLKIPYQKYADPSRPSVVGPSYQITDGLFLFLDDVPVPHPIAGYVPLPVDRVEIVVLSETGYVGLGTRPGHIVGGPAVVTPGP